jgi:hypothetical protein
MTMLKGVVADGHRHARGDPRLPRRRQDRHGAEAGPHGGYSTGKYVASFVGIVPASRPRLVVLVTGRRAARRDLRRRRRRAGVPADREFDLQYLEVPPDAPTIAATTRPLAARIRPRRPVVGPPEGLDSRGR